MIVQPHTNRWASEDGFTLVELLAGISISLVLLLATLTTFDGFGSASARNNKLTTAQDALRLRVDEMSQEIRNAQISATGLDPLLLANPNDLIVRNVDAAGTPVLIRYCLNTATRSLWRQTAPDGTSAGACDVTASAWQSGRIAAGNVANTGVAGQGIFTPNVTSPLSAIRSVGISLRLDSGTPGRFTVLGTAVALRSASGRPLTLSAGDIRSTCQPDGSALLDLIVSTDQSGSPLHANAESTNGVSLGSFSASQTVRIGATVQGPLRIVVTNALGLEQIIFKTVTCP